MTHVHALEIGTELVGDYRIDRVLGAGGFGITYLAQEVSLARPVTLKEYFPSDFAVRETDGTAVARSDDCGPDFNWGLDRFVDEAQILAKFDHPNIVKVYRYFRGNGTAYMALKWEEGQNVKAWLTDLKRTPRQKELDDLVAPLLDALEVVHAAEFLHRDIAPDNIIIRADGSPVLIDFGSARGELAKRTRTVSALVKPGYSPYEQYAEDSASQGPWSDIYALGATLYHLATGKRPLDSPARVVKDDLKPVEEAALGAFRPKFLHAIDRALALDIERRPRSVAEWRRELLAEEPKRSVWPVASKANPGSKDEPSASGEAAPPETVPVAPITVAAPPPVATRPIDQPPAAPALRRAPQAAQGSGLMSRLRGHRSGAKADAKPVSPTAKTPQQKEPVVRQGQPSMRFGIGWGPRRKAAAAAKVDAGGSGQVKSPKGAKAPKKAKAKAKSASRPPGTPAGRAIQAIAVGVPALRNERKPPRPPRKPWIRWRSLAFKLVLGAFVAGGAIALQRSLPDAPAPTASVPATPTTTGTVVRSYLATQFKAHDGAVQNVAFANDGAWIVTTGSDATLNVRTNGEHTLVRSIALSHGPATSLDVRGTRAVTGHGEGEIDVWDLATGLRIAALKRNDAHIWSVLFLDRAGQRIAAAGHDWSIALWDLTKPALPYHVFEGHDSAVQSLALTPDRRLLISGSADKSIRVWDLTSLTLRDRRRDAQRDFITALAMPSDGDVLASGDLSGTIRVWSGDLQRRRMRLSRHSAAITGLAFLADGRVLASVSEDGRLIMWDIRSGRSLKTFGSRGNEINGLAVVPGGRQIATAGADGAVRFWNIPLEPGSG